MKYLNPQTGETFDTDTGEISPPNRSLDQPLPPLGTLDSFQAGVAHGAESVATRAQDVSTYVSTHPFSPEAVAEREGIKNDWLKQQELFQKQTSQHPIASILGQSVVPALMSGGRTPVMGLLRGAMAGFSQYSPDSTATALNTGLGGVLGATGSKIAEGLQTPLAQRASNVGLDTLPEQAGPTLMPETAKKLYTYQIQAFKNNFGNQKTITRQALKELGDNGDRFTDSTIADASKRIGEMFNKATGSKENLLIKDTSFLDDFANTTVEGKKVAARAKEIKRQIDINNNILPVDAYQKLRSDLTTAISSTKDGNKVNALGQLVDYLDANAQANLSPEVQGLFNTARQKWKTMVSLSRPNIANWETGLVDPNKLHKSLWINDRPGYLMKGNNSPLYEMVRIQSQLSGASKIASSPESNIGNLRMGLSGGGQPGIGYYTKRGITGPLGKTILGINRQPQTRLSGLLPGIGLGTADYMEQP